MFHLVSRLSAAALQALRKCDGFVAVLLATVLALACPRPAAAQSGNGAWSFGAVYYNDVAQVNGQSYYGSPDMAWTWMIPVRDENSDDAGASGSALLRGRERIIATWTPPYYPGSASGSGSASALTPAPPADVTVRIMSGMSASFGGPPARASFPWVEINNGFGDAVVPTATSSGKQWDCGGVHLKKLNTSGGSWVQDPNAPWDPTKKVYQVTFDVDVSAGLTVISTDYTGIVEVRVGGATVVGDTRSMSLYADSGSHYWIIKNETDNKEIGAYAKLDWSDDGVAEHPLMPFYSGAASVSLFASNGANPINLQNYQWSSSPAPYTPSTPPANPYSTAIKDYSWNLGTSASSLPQSASVTVSASDPSDGTQFSGKAKINFHWAFEGGGGGDNGNDDDPNPPITQLPGSTVDKLVPGQYGGTPNVVPTPIQQIQVGDKIKISGSQMRQTVQSITTNPDTSITIRYGLDADDNPADLAYDLNTQISRLHDASQQVVNTGAKYTGAAFKSYGEAAKFLAMGPLSEAGISTLTTLGGDAVDLLNAARNLREDAQEAGAMASEAQTIANEAEQARQGVTDVQQAAKLEQEAEQAREKVTQLEAGAADAQSLAEQSENLGRNARMVQDAFQDVPPGARIKANAAFLNNSRLSEMTMAEREAVAEAFERIAPQTGNKFQEATRLYNLERAKFLRGEVDHLARTVVDFIKEKGLPWA